MKNFTKKAELQQYLATLRAGGAIVTFVPTMGALHPGHLSLIKQAQQLGNVVVCSIFVNPTQFNDTKDLEIYPRPILEDIKKLEQVNCDILFNPDVDEMYAGNESWHLDIGELEGLLEGKFRPGHYQGVTQVVYKLFTIVKPDIALFGQKDYQQFLVISRMVSLLNLPVKLVMCPIARDADGLALSSRNIHLTPADRQHALILSKTLNSIKQQFSPDHIDQLQQQAVTAINKEPGVTLGYFEIADAETLHPASKSTKKFIALVAATVGKTRLIDNVVLKD
ncbi:pantoate--beta-alanine ligase [Mucilaginibacter sp. UR6-11]|uniref:pantoate--beta-alanine ligase n=1 Tax=Mucilaginibacter sp. UR6-11 TaxID=1435644 RepID=UPI001E65CD25|nr:pantoate--beta-alanine ligase [Mucilaginibacter sp. UR6-11]MCC8424490.1 pantoate--beta-alanine ligase [Mucilaginibacter sp. UR6-11]